MTNKNIPKFDIQYEEVLERIEKINPLKYAKSRNFIDGHITYLSPFITHGIISPRLIASIVLKKYSAKDSLKLLQELGWREFFHRVWEDKQDEIFQDLRFDQSKVSTGLVPKSIIEATCGITALDEGINDLYETGYLHNHSRMWTASVVTNVAQTHWYQGARWMYYHLLDGDLASNTLSWQWIAGTFSHKKYYANQENLNKYWGASQTHTFLDVPYERFDEMEIPSILRDRTEVMLESALPSATLEALPEDGKPIFLYSIWNLDPFWKKEEEGHRILLIEPKYFRDWPLSPKRWAFILHWVKQLGLEILVADFDSLSHSEKNTVFFKEYPACKHWRGTQEERDWLYSNTKGYFKNFFSFWKSAQKEIKF